MVLRRNSAFHQQKEEERRNGLLRMWNDLESDFQTGKREPKMRFNKDLKIGITNHLQSVETRR